ncbi:DUF6304 family protein [Aquimarina sp. SS2-1]|uniref:DUF6304 family protein n=1 Tax=Aquimarina besae TaxID=3342247 RepID=UPI003670D1C4
MREYPATYQDKRGTEEIIIKSDGSDMYFTLRGIDFEGTDFEMLTAEEIDDSKFDYEMFADGSGDITNFKLTITIPTQFYNSLSNQTFTESLVAHIEVGETTAIDGLDSEISCLKLTTSFGEFTVEKKLEWMEDALIALQDQLPPNIYLKTCLSCKYSNYSPYGNGMFGNIYCFKKIKEALKKVQQKHDLLHLWTAELVQEGKIFSVQETFDCPEHRLPTEGDWYYKSWRKLISKNEEMELAENSLFYKEMNTLLRNQFSAIKQAIHPRYEQLLKERQFYHALPIICRFEYSSYGGNRQWRLELDFDEYQWSNETVKPHFLNALVYLSIGKELIYFKYQLCSSFNDELFPMEEEKIEIQKLNDTDFVTEKINEVQQFLNSLPKRFIQEIEKIDFDDLEFLEDMEELYQVINLHKRNDTKEFHARTQLFLLDAIALMSMHINDYEKIILEYARKMYTKEIPFCMNTLKSFRIIIAKKRLSEVNNKEERVHVLQAMNGFLTPFEEYNKNDKIERPYELEYKIDDLMQAGLEWKQLIPLLKEHFPEI